MVITIYIIRITKNNYEIVMELVKNNGFTLRYASEELQNNYKIVMAVVKNDGFTLQCASK
jgi:hypothetical protein